MKYILNIFFPLLIGVVLLYSLDYYFDLVSIFGNVSSYVYYYMFSTIAQGYVALVGFLGALAVFKLQADENKKITGIAGIIRNADFILKLGEAQRQLTFNFKKFAIVCLFDVGFALVGIPLIPLFNLYLIGPLYLGGSIVLSLWVLWLVYPIIQTILNFN